jgi:zinc protease
MSRRESLAAVDRSAPPPPGEVHPFRFPEFVRCRLPSGMQAYVARLPGAPLLSVELLAPAGAQFDPPDRSGLASFTAGLLDEGAAGRSALEVAAALESLGGQLGSSADWDVGYAAILTLSRHLEAGLRLLAEAAAAPTFDDEEIERLRRQRLTELVRRRQHPSVLADEQLAAAIYRGTVYANPPVGTQAAISTVSRDEIVDFYGRRYRLPAATLVVVSDLDPDVVLAEANRALAAAASGGAAPAPAPNPAAAGAAPPAPRHAADDSDASVAAHAASAGPHAAIGAADQPAIEPARLPGRRVYIVDRPGSAQTELRLGHASVPRGHPDAAVLSFLNTVLGGKFTSRINLNLRERHGYSYTASTRFAGRLGPGPFLVSAAVATESTGAAAREVLSELQRIQDEPIGADELDETRSFILGVFPYTLQSNADLARRLADLAVYGLADDYFDANQRLTAALGQDDVQRAAQRHLDPDHIAIVAVGPADVLRPQLEALGELVVSSPDDLSRPAG